MLFNSLKNHPFSIQSWSTGGSFRKNSMLSVLIGSMVVSLSAQSQPVLVGELEPNPQFVVFDAKTYPGINCEAQAVVEIDLFANIGFDMANANQGKRSVVCPVVRDNTANTNGTFAAYVNVSNAPNRTLECTLYSYDKFGSIIDSYTSATSNQGNQTLYLDVDVSIESGFYGIHCTLPNTSAVRSYEVREYLDTDNRS